MSLCIQFKIPLLGDLFIHIFDMKNDVDVHVDVTICDVHHFLEGVVICKRVCGCVFFSPEVELHLQDL